MGALGTSQDRGAGNEQMKHLPLIYIHIYYSFTKINKSINQFVSPAFVLGLHPWRPLGPSLIILFVFLFVLFLSKKKTDEEHQQIHWHKFL